MSAETGTIVIPASNAGVQATALCFLCYQSRARQALSAHDLDALVTSARERNGAEAITGMLIYDPRRRRFFQWLEGPPDAIARIWTAIQADARHTDLDLLDARPALGRYFADWDLKVITDGDEVTRQSRASLLLAALDGHRLAPLLNRFKADAARQRSGALATLLLERDPAGAEGFIRNAHARSDSLLDTFTELFEPTARRLGDDWVHERCTEPEMIIALARLQSAAHRLAGSYCPLPSRGVQAVLSAPAGESHLLGSAMLGELLWLQGWQVDVQPGYDKAPDRRSAPELFVVCVSPALKRGLRGGWDKLLASPPPRRGDRRGVYARLAEGDAEAWSATGADFVHEGLREVFLDSCGADGSNRPEPNQRLDGGGSRPGKPH